MDRLVVLGDDGNLRVAGAGGTIEAELTTDAGGGVGYHHTTWTADGAHVVWCRSEHATAGRLEVAGADGKGRWATDPGFVAFYLYPAPDGRRVAHLSEGPLGLELGVLDLEGGHNQLLARGVPLYWSWAPDGGRIVAHVGDELVLLSLDGTSEVVGGEAGGFLAPGWSAGGHLVYVARGEDRQRLVLASPGGEGHSVVAEFEGVGRFVVDPAGRRLAYSVQREGPGAVVVADLVTGDTSRPVLDRPVIAFWWSPDSSRLLLLGLVRGVAHPWMQWWVWEGEEGGEARELGRFVPTAAFARGVLPFFEQFAQSHRLWAPDSRAFAYPGLSESGRTGVWVQALDGSEPRQIAGGLSAWWSPV